MGMFSWKTSDTGKSIPNMASSRSPIPVWMLLPSGRRAVYEPRYSGYGDFGGLDFYEETAIATLGRAATKGVDTETLRSWGITLCYLGDPDTRQEAAAKNRALAWWLLKVPERKVRMPRLVEHRCPYSSVPDSPYCPEQGY
jgi:hypothetical protein